VLCLETEPGLNFKTLVLHGCVCVIQLPIVRLRWTTLPEVELFKLDSVEMVIDLVATDD